MKHNITYSVILFFLFFMGCQGDSPAKEPEIDFSKQLPGHWELLSATRDDSPTQSLTGLFFDFTADGKMKTNLMGTEAETVFSIADKKISQSLGGQPLEYQIVEMDSTRMVLDILLRGSQFQFELKKQ